MTVLLSCCVGLQAFVNIVFWFGLSQKKNIYTYDTFSWPIDFQSNISWLSWRFFALTFWKSVSSNYASLEFQLFTYPKFPMYILISELQVFPEKPINGK